LEPPNKSQEARSIFSFDILREFPLILFLLSVSLVFCSPPTHIQTSAAGSVFVKNRTRKREKMEKERDEKKKQREARKRQEPFSFPFLPLPTDE
jgi:hypothetical protein